MRLHKYLLVALISLFTSISAQASETLTVVHQALTAPTLIDNGLPGQSVGDVRIFQFDAQTTSGDNITVDWIMTTTGVEKSSMGEYRMSAATFSFGSTTKEQIVIQGIAQYSSASETLKSAVSTTRAVTGGTGKYANASGWMETTHLTDGTSKHVLHLK
jgi:hypothetical protein